MKRFIVLTLVVCLSLLLQAFAVAQGSEKEKTAITAAKKWLSLTDSGNYKRSWMDSAGYFRNAITEERWFQNFNGGKDSLGSSYQEKLKVQSTNHRCPVSRMAICSYTVETSSKTRKSSN